MNENYKILYAEDEDSLREITSELLSSEGFQCVAVSNGLEAMEKLEREDFDLLLTDFRMPGMDGALLLFWCRQNGKHMPVIFISGNMERLPLEGMALKDCCTALLQKPVAFDELLEAITAARGRRHEFDCRGESFNADLMSNDTGFTGQHFLNHNLDN